MEISIGGETRYGQGLLKYSWANAWDANVASKVSYNIPWRAIHRIHGQFLAAAEDQGG